MSLNCAWKIKLTKLDSMALNYNQALQDPLWRLQEFYCK